MNTIHKYLSERDEPRNKLMFNVIDFFYHIRYTKINDKQYGILLYRVNTINAGPIWSLCINRHRFSYNSSYRNKV